MKILLLALVAALPTQADVEDFNTGNSGGSCVMFTNGVCICSDPEAFVRDLICNETEAADEAICSYNVMIEDRSGIDGTFAAQRMDTFKRDAQGKWQFDRAFHEPVSIKPFSLTEVALRAAD